jgi:chromosome segregation ATPase
MKASENATKRADLEAQIAALEAEKEDTEETLVEAKAAIKNPEKDPRKTQYGAEAHKLNEAIAAASEDTIATLVEEIRELRKALAKSEGEETGEGSVGEDEHTGADGDRGFFGNIWGGKQ